MRPRRNRLAIGKQAIATRWSQAGENSMKFCRETMLNKFEIEIGFEMLKRFS